MLQIRNLRSVLYRRCRVSGFGTVSPMTDQLKQQLQAVLWRSVDPHWPWWQRTGLRAAQLAAALLRELSRGELSMRAMSLVYTTLLSLVPLLALSFSVLKALGVHNSMEPVLLRLLAPLGDKSVELTETVIGFVENIRVGVLGFFGILLLFYTAVSMLQKVEKSFNRIWRIERTRPLARRFGDYLSVLIVGPVLVFSAVGVTATASTNTFLDHLTHLEPLGSLIAFAGRFVPYLLVIAAFTFLYAFIPNTRVRLGSAIGGALLSGLMWESASLAFAEFAASATTYNAVYSSFALLLFLLIWLYVGWLILLIGCQMAFLLQYPNYIRPSTTGSFVGNRTREHLALQLMSLIAQRFVTGAPPMPATELANETGERPEAVFSVVDRLVAAGLLVEIEGASMALLPARDLDNLLLADIIETVRSDRADEPDDKATPAMGSAVRGEIRAYESAIREALGQRSLRDLVGRASKDGA